MSQSMVVGCVSVDMPDNLSEDDMRTITEIDERLWDCSTATSTGTGPRSWNGRGAFGSITAVISP